MSEYNEDWKVKCPFYKKDIRAKIICESITNNDLYSTINFFKIKSEMLEHKEIFCRCDYKKCPLFIGLMSKYEDEDDEK